MKTLDRHQANLLANMNEFISKSLKVSPYPELKTGDKIVWMNDYGVEFDSSVTGFHEDGGIYFECSHEGAYWFDHNFGCILSINGKQIKENDKAFKDLTLNNGQKAKFIDIDFWDRPVYKLESGRKVCCIELNGTYLHTLSGDEPDLPLKEEFQPVKK